MPIITKPNCFDADYFFVCKGNEILVKDNSFISKKEFEFFANETFSDDWYIEKIFRSPQLWQKKIVQLLKTVNLFPSGNSALSIKKPHS